MIMKPEWDTTPPEALPGGFENDLRSIDREMTRYAWSIAPPVGLSERVFSASATNLPRPRMRLSATVHESAPRHRQSLYRLTWSRVALAASVGLAFVITSSLMRAPVAVIGPKLVRELFPDTSVYFMHPVKARAVIKTSYEVYGVRRFVIDHPSASTLGIDLRFVANCDNSWNEKPLGEEVVYTVPTPPPKP